MKRCTKSLKKLAGTPHGFTLIEAMIGIALFTIGFMAIAGLQTTGIHSNSLAQTATENTHHAMQAIEGLFAMGWDAPATQPNPGITESREGYTVNWSITTNPAPSVMTMVDDLGQPNVRLITVTSTYTDTGGTPRSVTFRMLKPRM